MNINFIYVLKSSLVSEFDHRNTKLCIYDNDSLSHGWSCVEQQQQSPVRTHLNYLTEKNVINRALKPRFGSQRRPEIVCDAPTQTPTHNWLLRQMNDRVSCRRHFVAGQRRTKSERGFLLAHRFFGFTQ